MSVTFRTRAVWGSLLVLAVVIGAVSIVVQLGQPIDTGGLCLERRFHDFGVVRSGEGVLTYRFDITNNGRDKTSLTLLKKGCNCLRVEYPRVLHAGEQGQVFVALETRDREGRFRTSVELATSDPKNNRIVLTLAFTGVPQIRINPPGILARDVEQGGIILTRMNAITSGKTLSDAMMRPRIECRSPAVTCSLVRSARRNTAGQRSVLPTVEHEFEIQIDTNKLPNGDDVYLNEALFFHSRVSNEKKSIPIRVRFQHHALLQGPKSIILTPDRKGQIVLRSRDGRAHSIARVIPKDSHIQCGFDRERRSSVLRVSLSVSRSSRVTAPTKSSVDIFLEADPSHPYRVSVVVL